MKNLEKINEFKKVKVKKFKHGDIDIDIEMIESETVNGVLCLKVTSSSPQVSVSQPIYIINPPDTVGAGVFDDTVIDGKIVRVERTKVDHEAALKEIIGKVYEQKKDGK